jgi:GTP cyclohydrolase I
MIAYAPRSGAIIDSAKLGSVVDVYAKRLQTPESLVSQIARKLFDSNLNPIGIGVAAVSNDLCSEFIGTRRQEYQTITSAAQGSFLENSVAKKEWSELITSLKKG